MVADVRWVERKLVQLLAAGPLSTRQASDPVHPRALRVSHLVHRTTIVIRCPQLCTTATPTCCNKKEWHLERCGRPGRALTAWGGGMSGDHRQERGWPLRAGCWDTLVCLLRVARTNGCWRCLCLVAKRHSCIGG